MTRGSGATRAPHKLTDEELVWIEANLTGLRRYASEHRILYPGLALGFVVGLAAHVGGYLLKLSATTQLLGLGADLLYALGWALWTGAVVVVFVQVLPEAKRRQIMRALDAYEAAKRDKARAGRDQTSTADGAQSPR